MRTRIVVLVCFVLLSAILTFSQEKEGYRKMDAKQKSASKTTAAPAADTDQNSDKDKDKEEKNEGDPLFRGMKYRSIGPYRGGRSLTAAGIPGDPSTYYFGATGGGVWKSTDGGNTWTSVFDKDGAPSIGSIAVAVSDPNIVYVGTGEACIRGNIGQGDGVWKSLDAGKSWKNIGLKDSRAIGRVIVNPRNPDIVFVAALGHPFGPNNERGVFRTTDGGKTWDKVLYKNDNTGAIDVAFDPQNPNILYASLWEARRTPWTLASGGPGSGIYRSTDGGSTWKHLEEHGLPKEPYGRIGLAVAANSERVYALIEAKDGGLYRSDDGGDTWDLVNGSHQLFQRAWYYMHVIADPQDANTVYVADVEFFKSTDGGRNFNKIKVPHGDNHGLWIDPKNTKRMIASDDGGVTISVDGGKSWTRQDNQPTAQFYHVITDTRTPYYVYGSQQDNSTVAIASRSDNGAIGREDWYEVGGGEAGYIAPDPSDPNIVYAGDYQGNITRFDRRTNQIQSIAVWPELSDARGAAPLDHRFQWTAPIVISPQDPKTVYYGGERIFKTTDAGMHWEAISGDLTRNDKSKQQPSGGPITVDDTGTEYYDTVFSIAPSPVVKGLIWAGTDDGLIQLTRDEGKNWTNVTPKDLADWSRISLIEASPHDAGKAYVAVDRHQNDDPSPYIYKTIDYGATWTRITTGIPDGVFVRAVREDPKKKGLLYAGTERGVFVSFDDGAHWRSLQNNLPIVPVHDLVIKNDDLVLATHGRAFWILDDVSPLRQFVDSVAAEDVHLYQPATAYRLHTGEAPSKLFFDGRNPPSGAVIYYYLKPVPKADPQKDEARKEEVRIEILDASGTVIRKYSSRKNEALDEPLDPEDKKPEKQIKPEDGLNRFVWDLHYEEANRVPGYFLWEYQEGAKGPLALPGHYQVRFTAKGKSVTAPFAVKIDPRVTTSQSDLEKQFKLELELRDELNRVYGAVNQIQDVREQLTGLKKRLGPGDSTKAVFDGATALEAKLIAVRDPLINFRISASEDSLAYAPGIDAKLAFLSMGVSGFADSAPTAAQYQEFDKLKKQTDELLAGWDQVRNTDIANFQKLAAEQNIHSIYVPDVRSERVQGEGEE
ncbi:MAG: WD40/YVTN/BNR-like repeat-containing protein [Terriglobales bacterium]